MLDLTLTEIGERKLRDVQFMELLCGISIARDFNNGSLERIILGAFENERNFLCRCFDR